MDKEEKNNYISAWGGGGRNFPFCKLCNPGNIRRYFNEQEVFQSASQTSAGQDTRKVYNPLPSRNEITPVTS